MGRREPCYDLLQGEDSSPHEIKGGPVFVVECLPDGIAAINRDRAPPLRRRGSPLQ